MELVNGRIALRNGSCDDRAALPELNQTGNHAELEA